MTSAISCPLWYQCTSAINWSVRLHERIGFGLYQSWRNMGKVGYVSVLWLRWSLGGAGGRLGPGSGRVGWCYVCVCCESGFFVLMAIPGICILC